jgi:hypothetical protein
MIRNIKGQYVKGFCPPTAFKKGIIPWNKGISRYSNGEKYVMPLYSKENVKKYMKAYYHEFKDILLKRINTPVWSRHYTTQSISPISPTVLSCWCWYLCPPYHYTYSAGNPNIY